VAGNAFADSTVTCATATLAGANSANTNAPRQSPELDATNLIFISILLGSAHCTVGVYWTWTGKKLEFGLGVFFPFASNGTETRPKEDVPNLLKHSTSHLAASKWHATQLRQYSGRVRL